MARLSNKNSDGYKKVTWNVNSRCFKLYRAYSISFNSANNDEFFRSWIRKDCIEVQEKRRKLLSCVNVFVDVVACNDGNELYILPVNVRRCFLKTL